MKQGIATEKNEKRRNKIKEEEEKPKPGLHIYWHIAIY